MYKLIINSLLAILSVAFPLFVSAQDKIITNDDKIIVGYNLEIGKSAVFYTDSQDVNSDLHRIDISNIMLIKKADGSVFNPGKENGATVEAPAVQPEKIENTEIVLSESTKQKNQDYIAKINTKYEFLDNAELKRDKKTKTGVLQYGVSENSIVKTNELKLYLSADMKVIDRHMTPFLTVNAENLTDKVVYVDLGNTFFNSDCIYVPTATQVSSTSTKGGSINLGGVANALGVGGAVGVLASGINVGGSNGNTVSEIQYSQRIIAIPPHSVKEVFSRQLYNRDIVTTASSWTISIYAIRFDESKANQGEIIDYVYNGNPSAKVFITYNMAEDLSGPMGKMQVEIYPMRLLFTPVKRLNEMISNNTDNGLWYYTGNVGK